MSARDRCSNRRSATGGRDGMTLVEVMVAIAVMVVMALGSSAYLVQCRAGVGIQRDRRASLESANSRLEHIRASNYDDIVPTGSGVYYLRRYNGTWAISSSDPGETVTLNGRSLPMVTTVQRVRQTSAPAQEYVVVRVAVGYRPGSADRVRLATIVSP